MNAQMIQDIFCKDGNHLGDLCGWSLHGSHDQTKVSELARYHGLEDDLGLPNLPPSNGYRRAIIDAVKGKRDEVRYDAVKLEESDTKIVHAIVRRSIIKDCSSTNGHISDKDASYDTEVKIAFDKESAINESKSRESLITYDNPDHPVSKYIQRVYENLCVTYSPDHIRIAFQRAFESWGAIRLLGHGGLWWIPAPYSDKVRAWKAFMADLGYTTLVIPVFDTQETIDSLIQQSTETLEAQLSAMIQELNDFAGKDNVRPSTLQKRVEQFDKLREKVELHAQVLGNKQNELIQRLDSAQKGLVKSMLNPVEETKTQKTPNQRGTSGSLF
jgi:hypothetical protein